MQRVENISNQRLKIENALDIDLRSKQSTNLPKSIMFKFVSNPIPLGTVPVKELPPAIINIATIKMIRRNGNFSNLRLKIEIA